MVSGPSVVKVEVDSDSVRRLREAGEARPATVAECLSGEVLLVHEAALHQRAQPHAGGLSASGSVAVVDIMGPLSQRAEVDYFGATNGYDTIEGDFAEALRSDAEAIVLRIDSPGGDAAGCFEAVRRMRSAAAASGKPVVAFADEMAASAAYALACVADSGIVVPSSGMVGSVGVIAMHVSQSRALLDAGVDVRVFRSGKRKAEGTMAEPLSDEAAEAKQSRVDALAGQFGALVAEARGLSADAVLGHEGAIFTASEGLAHGFADRIGSMDDAVAMAAKAARARKKERKMEQINALVGLAADASEEQMLAEVARAVDANKRLLATIGAKSVEDAVGVVEGLAAVASQVDTMGKRIVELEGAQAAVEVDAAIREGSEAGKIVASTEAFWRAKPAAEIRAFLAVAPVVVNREAASAAPAPTSGLRLWSDLSVEEKSRLQNEDPELFAALLKDHRSRNGGRN